MKIANRIVMTITSLVFIFAVTFKIKQLLTEPIISTGFWQSREFYIIQVVLELGLAIWLICGIFRKFAWLIATIGFAGFSCITLYKALGGFESCGCFGTVKVNPWITLLAVDLPILILLLIFRPRAEKFFDWPRLEHLIACAVPTFMLLGFVGYVTTHYEPASSTQEYEVVDAQGWIGKPLPMLEYIDLNSDADLNSGICVILFYHFDCPNCRVALPIYNEMNEMLMGNQDEIKFAFIEMPPYGGEEDENPVPQNTQCITGKLREDKKFYAASPLLIITHDSIVTKVFEVEVPLKLDELLDAVMQ